MKQANENLQVMESMVPPAGAVAPAAPVVPASPTINIKIDAANPAPTVPPAPVSTAVLPTPAPSDNAMANTYGFLRSASNNVGNTVEGVLTVEGSLADMKKDLDTEYTRWQAKKKALLQEREKLNSEKSRLNGALQKQKDQRAEKERIAGSIATLQAENSKAVSANLVETKKNAYDKKTP